jgi:RNA-directed DNA polymerase
LIISEMQHKLATWAAADQTRRFDRLLRLITDRNWLAEAARIVLASKGASTPGLDGMDKRRLAADLDRHLERLRVALLDGTYRPRPVKRIHIPKPSGKLRPLGIPILLDRIVQRAMLMAMEPIWESDFHSGSYELSPKVGDGGNRKGGISWGCLTPPLLHRRSDMPCPKITSSS